MFLNTWAFYFMGNVSVSTGKNGTQISKHFEQSIFSWQKIIQVQHSLYLQLALIV